MLCNIGSVWAREERSRISPMYYRPIVPGRGRPYGQKGKNAAMLNTCVPSGSMRYIRYPVPHNAHWLGHICDGVLKIYAVTKEPTSPY